MLLPTLKYVRDVDVMQALVAPGFVHAVDSGSWFGPSMSEDVTDVVPYVLFSPVRRSVFSRRFLVTDRFWDCAGMHMPWFLQFWYVLAMDPHGDPSARTRSGCIAMVCLLWWTWEPDVWVMSIQLWQT